ncbi:hypothetical protein [Thiofilum flexile]|uniref:hypothetical protein n=1 Tax=Thiofilum flexile TaxID=125627 RepID=UPI0003792570|nr:hypothetical protein [Thiofilum flexile]
MSSIDKRQLYRVLMKGMVLFGLIVLLGVLLRSFISTSEVKSTAELETSSQLTVPLTAPVGKVQLIRWGQQEVGVLRLSEAMQASLNQANTRAPDTQMHNPAYFVYLNKGAGIGCPITLITEVRQSFLRDTCTQASYDLTGRPLNSALNIPALTVPPHYVSQGKITLGAWK